MKRRGLIIIFLICTTFKLSAQQRLLKQVDNRIVYEKLDSVTKQARVKTYDIKPKKKRLYYWYWKNSFQQNYGGFEGSLLHGDYIVYDKEENLLEKAVFKKGIIRGKYLYWNKQGILIKQERWKCGVKSGLYKVFNDEGELIEKGRNCNALKNGISRFFVDGKEYKTLKYKKGKLVKDISAEKRENDDEGILKKRERLAKKKEAEAKKTKKEAKEKPKKKEKAK